MHPPAALSAIPAGSRILFAGDSITQGFFSGGVDTSYRWCAPFETYLTAQFTAAHKTPPTLINTGVSGQTSSALLSGINAQILTQSPDRVFLQIGTNDITFGVPYETTRDNIASIISTTRGSFPNCLFYVLSLFMYFENWPKGQNPGTPPGSGDGPWDLLDAALYDGVRTTLGTASQWVYIRDACFSWEAQYNAGHSTTGYLTTDGVHPTKQGTGSGPISGAELISQIVQSQITLAT